MSGSAPQSEARKTAQDGQQTFGSTVISWVWRLETRLKSTIGIASDGTTEERTLRLSRDSKTKDTNTDRWVAQTVLFALSGILGMTGTMMLWNCGIQYQGAHTFFGPRELWQGFVGVFLSILSVFMLNAAFPDDPDFDQ